MTLAPRPIAMTIGVFDGLHRGHQRVIAATVEAAREVEGSAVVTTFDPHPDAIVRGAPTRAWITPPDEREALLHDLGVDRVHVVRFDKEVQALAAHLHRRVERGPLQGEAAEPLHPRLDVPGSGDGVPGTDGNPRPILRVGRDSQASARPIALGEEAQGMEERGRASLGHEKEPRREGIERPGVADAALPQHAAHPGDHVVRGPALGLIEKVKEVRHS